MESGQLTGPTLVRFSRQLSWVLRHGAQRSGLEPDEDGWVKVSNLLKCRYFANKTEDAIIEAIKAANRNKRRYALQYTVEGAAQVRACRHQRDQVGWPAPSDSRQDADDWETAARNEGTDALQSLLRQMRESRDATSLCSMFSESASPKDYDSAIIECIPLQGAARPFPTPTSKVQAAPVDEGPKHAEVKVDCSAWATQQKRPNDDKMIELARSVLTGCGFALEELGTARLSKSRHACFIEVLITPPSGKEGLIISHLDSCKAAARTIPSPWAQPVNKDHLRRLIPTLA
mmetsp:Transcript_32716/g.72795  ORF Transcript_32716/g.72795 Transcript_32716/m.72795 type:complete len:289 (-) Transcript_32716:125-991(-)